MRAVLRNILALSTSIVYIMLPISHASATSSAVVIRELQVRSATSAYEEYVVLYNNSDQVVTVEGWTLDYRTATGSTWTTRVKLTGVMQQKEHYALASEPYSVELLTEQLTGGALSDSGGHLRLSSGQSVIDLVGWGSAVGAETAAAAVPEKGLVLSRTLLDGVYVDTDNNALDFVASPPNILHTHITPLPTPKPTPIPTPVASVTPKATPQSTRTAALPGAAIEISELFPDPVSPQTDANDEFIELYNPTTATVSLDGYLLQSGNNFSSKQLLDGYTIAANSYLALYGADTTMSLSNGGAAVRILGPDGAVLHSIDYPKAVAGQAYAAQTDRWVWTEAATPGTENKYETTVVEGAQTEDTTTRTANSTKQSATSTPKGTTATAFNTAQSRPISALVLVGVGTLALLYVLYEYRFDIRNRIHQLRTYLTARKRAR